MSNGSPPNRRERPRSAFRLPVRFGTESRMCGGVAVDISEGGLRVVAPESFPVHSLLDVFVQFPGHAVRLRAKVVWTGGGGEGGGGPVMGLAFTGPVPTLAGAYKRWLAEMKQAGAEHSTGAPDPGSAAAQAPESAATPAAGESKSASPAPPAAPEPTGPVKRRLESPQGQSYDILLEPHILGWRLQIVQLPHPPGVHAPDHDKTYPDYAAAEAAMRTFVRAH
jgi:hypothetical protein